MVAASKWQMHLPSACRPGQRLQSHNCMIIVAISVLLPPPSAPAPLRCRSRARRAAAGRSACGAGSRAYERSLRQRRCIEVNRGPCEPQSKTCQLQNQPWVCIPVAGQDGWGQLHSMPAMLSSRPRRAPTRHKSALKAQIVRATTHQAIAGSPRSPRSRSTTAKSASKGAMASLSASSWRMEKSWEWVAPLVCKESGQATAAPAVLEVRGEQRAAHGEEWERVAPLVCSPSGVAGARPKSGTRAAGQREKQREIKGGVGTCTCSSHKAHQRARPPPLPGCERPPAPLQWLPAPPRGPGR